MILFYHPQTLRVVGTFNGRIHSDEEHNAHVGEVGQYKKFVFPMTKHDTMKEDGIHSEYLPDEPFREIFFLFESGKETPLDFEIIEEESNVVGLKKVVG